MLRDLLKPTFVLLAVGIVSGETSLGQTAPPQQSAGQDQAPSSGSRGEGGAKAGKNADPAQAAPVNNNVAARAGAMMARTNGSLWKATLAANAMPDPGAAKLAQVSYFAVAEPEPQTLKKHDLVTIVIREESSATTKGQNDLQKNVELQAEVNQMIKLKLGKGSIYGLPTPAATPGIDWTGARTFHGQGELDRSDTLTARITAEVLDVKPNGTLVLQARKHIKNDDEEQQFILTGICRAKDVNADNTILSTQLYDLSLQKNSKGDVRESTERGRLPKLLDFLNPF